MVSALAAYKAMILGSTTDTGSATPSPRRDGGADATAHADRVNLSTSQDVFTAVDNFFNLGASNRFDAFHKLSPDDKEQFVQIVADLAKSGYMGYEELVVNKKVERHDQENKIGDERIRGARVYDRAKETRRA